jgi:hypothetical protein
MVYPESSIFEETPARVNTDSKQDWLDSYVTY